MRIRKHTKSHSGRFGCMAFTGMCYSKEFKVSRVADKKGLLSWPRSAPELSGTSSAICPGTLRNLISFLHRNTPEPPQSSAREPSGTTAIYTRTLRNLIRYLPCLISYLRRNPPDPHQQSAPEPSGTSSAICTRRLRNLPEPSGTLWNLLWNLVLQLRRIAPELFWAKDPIASLAVGENYSIVWYIMLYHVL